MSGTESSLRVPADARLASRASKSSAASIPHRPEIDGLRAVAVVPVILFHAGFAGFGGGFVGVDVFFVISGYLIAQQILTESERGQFSLLRFYERRARRILPALFLVMACCVVAACLLMTAGQLKEFAINAVGVALFVPNIVFWNRISYFRAESALNPLLHTWSLGIEEQFYVLFPLLVLLLWPRRQRVFAAAIAFATAGSLLLGQWGSYAAPAAAFYLLPTRAWELLIGVGVALTARLRERFGKGPLAELLAVAGLAMIVASITQFDETTPTPGFYTLLPVCGAALVLAFASGGTIAAKILSLPPAVGIGLISYSAYLWHQPLFAFARIWGLTQSDQGAFALLSLASVVLAYFSWRYVEQPFRDRRRFSAPQIFAMAGAGSACLLALGLTGAATNGGDFRYTPLQKAVIASYGGAEARYSRIYRQNICFLSTSIPNPKFATVCYANIVGSAHATVLWGDSHAASLHMGLFTQLGASPKAQLTSAGCPPLMKFKIAGEPNCVALNDESFRLVSEAVRPRVFLSASWYTYYKRPYFAEALTRTIQALHKIGADVIVVGVLPQWRPSLPDLVASKMTGKGLAAVPKMLEVQTLDPLRNADDTVRDIASRNGARFISLLDGLCTQSKCQAIVDSNGTPRLVAWDYGHLTVEGSELDAAVLMRRLSRR